MLLALFDSVARNDEFIRFCHYVRLTPVSHLCRLFLKLLLLLHTIRLRLPVQSLLPSVIHLPNASTSNFAREVTRPSNTA